MVSVHTSLHAFETLDTRANNAELRVRKMYTRKRRKWEERRDKESTKEGRMEEMKMREERKESVSFRRTTTAVIQDERALICT